MCSGQRYRVLRTFLTLRSTEYGAREYLSRRLLLPIPDSGDPLGTPAPRSSRPVTGASPAKSTVASSESDASPRETGLAFWSLLGSQSHGLQVADEPALREKPACLPTFPDEASSEAASEAYRRRVPLRPRKSPAAAPPDVQVSVNRLGPAAARTG